MHLDRWNLAVLNNTYVRSEIINTLGKERRGEERRGEEREKKKEKKKSVQWISIWRRRGSTLCLTALIKSLRKSSCKDAPPTVNSSYVGFDMLEIHLVEE